MKWQIASRNSDQDLLAHLLQLRGVEDAQRFFHPELEHIHPYSSLHDAVGAAKVIKEAISDQKQIFIHGDYDVDGVCATALLWNFLYRDVGYEKVMPFIPSRFDDGYGLSPASLDQLVEQGAELVITVDCGVKDLELIRTYTERGLQFVITDHHQLAVDSAGAPSISSAALAVVHPRHPAGDYPFVDICGTTVVWKLVQALAVELKSDYGTDEYLDLVALATVCDVMPLVDENRAIVTHGLRKLRENGRAGLRALLRVAQVEPSAIDTYHLGFVLGPRLNAAGRISSAKTALRLLTTTSATTAAQLAAELDELNRKRQQLTRHYLTEAEAQIATQAEALVHFVYGDDWPEGIVGLIAGKLAEQLYRPVMVGSKHDDLIVGSARSPVDLHLANAFRELTHLLERHGGHALAAGFTMRVENVPQLREQINAIARRQLGSNSLERTLTIDAELAPGELSAQLIEQVSVLAPFGYGNVQPIFSLPASQVVGVRRFGKANEHVAWQVEFGGVSLEVVSFNGQQQWGGLVNVGDLADFAGTLRLNSWGGKLKLELGLKDVRFA